LHLLIINAATFVKHAINTTTTDNMKYVQFRSTQLRGR